MLRILLYAVPHGFETRADYGSRSRGGGHRFRLQRQHGGRRAGRRRRAGRGRGGRGGGGDAPVVTAKVAEKDVPDRHRGDRQRRSLRRPISVRSQVTGPLDRGAVPRRRLRQEGTAALHDRSAAVRGGARAGRGQPDARPGAAGAGRSAARRATRRTPNTQQLTARAPGAARRSAASSPRTRPSRSRAQADATAAAVKADKAAIESARAQLVAQQAAVDNAQVQLSYTTIRSPIDGRPATSRVKVGNLVTANQTELMTIAQLQPVYVTFTVPAVHLAHDQAAHGRRHSSPVTATPQDADAQPATGALTFVDNAVDSTTDTIKLKATFDNADRRLWPGQFARVTLRLRRCRTPWSCRARRCRPARTASSSSSSRPDSTVEQRPVTVGQRVDDDVVVEKGLKPGETIVTEGQLRLEPARASPTGRRAAAAARRRRRTRTRARRRVGRERRGQWVAGGRRARAVSRRSPCESSPKSSSAVRSPPAC